MHFTHELYLLVTCLTAFTGAIRVYWNTNTGPIVPPTPRTTVRPQPPFREPAPVWEDQSNDIPNPNPYVFVLPPPSRPRVTTTNNYLNSDRQAATNYGSIVAPSQVSSYLQQQGNTNSVPSLAVKYIPNVGNKYYAVVPGKGYYPDNYSSSGSSNNNGINSNIDKLQGKYNAKTKKYKAYEKVKYVPQTNYLPLYHFELPQEQSYDKQFNQQLLLETQQLPMATQPEPFSVEKEVLKSTAQQEQKSIWQQAAQPKVSYEKIASEKSQLLKEKFNGKSASLSKNSILS